MPWTALSSSRAADHPAARPGLRTSSRPRLDKPLAGSESCIQSPFASDSHSRHAHSSRGRCPSQFHESGSSAARARSQAGVRQTLVHTGQHYDPPCPTFSSSNWKCPSPIAIWKSAPAATPSRRPQSCSPSSRFVLERKPDLVLVYGDVNSTVAAALVCSKLGVPVGHVEAGLRSRDRTMPEEINRLLTDQLSDLLFTPSSDGDENLLREGIDRCKIHLVGNVMIDTLSACFLAPSSSLASDSLAPMCWSRCIARRTSTICPGFANSRHAHRTEPAAHRSFPGASPHSPAPSRYSARTLKPTPALTVARSPALSGFPRPAASRRAGHHRFRRHSGGNHSARCPVSHGARKYRTPHHPHQGTNQLVGRDLQRLRAAAETDLQQKSEGQ